MGLKIGICGIGNFAPCFTRLFKAHPLVEELVLADLIPERARQEAQRLGIPSSYWFDRAFAEVLLEEATAMLGD